MRGGGGKDTSGWGGVRVKNLLEVEAGRWLYFQALKVKTERIAKPTESMATVEIVVTIGEIELSGDDEDNSDVNNDVV